MTYPNLYKSRPVLWDSYNPKHKLAKRIIEIKTT